MNISLVTKKLRIQLPSTSVHPESEIYPLPNTYIITVHCKTPENSDRRKNYCNCPKCWLIWIIHRVMHINNADGMIWVYTVCSDGQQICLSKNLGSLWYIQCWGSAKASKVVHTWWQQKDCSTASLNIHYIKFSERMLIFSAVNHSSHRCGFEPSLCHMWDKPSSACGWSGVFFSGISCFHPTLRLTQLKMSEIILTGCKT